MTPTKAFHLSLSGQRAPVDYDRAATYSGMIAEKDVLVPMRDGVKIAIDVYRPDTRKNSLRCSPSRSTTRTCRGPTSPRRR